MFGCLDVWIRPPTVDAMVTIACKKTAAVHTHHAGGYRVKKLGASPSSRPLRRPAAAHLLPAAACLAAACRISFFRNFAILPTALRD